MLKTVSLRVFYPWMVLSSVILLPACELGTEPVSPPAVQRLSGFSKPESVLSWGTRVFVSNMGAELAPADKDADGFISELDESGRVVTLKAFPPASHVLHAPKGMAASQDRLYVADIDRVVGFDLHTGEQTFESQAIGPAFLNDLASEDEDHLLVTDTSRGTVLRLGLRHGEWEVLSESIPGANGVTVSADRSTAYVVSVGANLSGGEVYALPLKGGPPRPINQGPHGFFDGVALLSEGELLVSDWVAMDKPTQGALLRVNLDGEVKGVLELPEPLYGPADLDVAREALWIPVMLADEVWMTARPKPE